VERYLPETLNEQQVEHLLEVMPTHGPMALRNRAIFEVLYGCGIRVSELCGIRVEDLDLETRVLRVTGKGDKTRVIPVGSRAANAVSVYLAGERPGLVRKWTRSHLFLSVRGKALTPDRIWQLAKECARAAGLSENVYPHLFRHSFATHLLGNGADLRVIQELLGHADIGTTQIYTHVDQQRLKSVHYRFHPRARLGGGGGGTEKT
jgi:integrase/recombinase XerD